MATYVAYVEAFRTDGSQILGNVDGQRAFRANYKRSEHYKALRNDALSVSRAVAFWRIVNVSGRVLETIKRNSK